MGKATGFIEFARVKAPARPVAERVGDFRHVQLAYAPEELTRQSARCMDCGVPFCHQGCPLGNQIPEWNDLVYRGAWRAASDRLHATNNFPEFTGLLCPAPCEGACVLGLNRDAVSIKSIELAIVDRAFDEGWIVAEPPVTRTWKKVAVVGSGPAGLAAAAELNLASHTVTVLEKADRIGGLLRYGIPEFKLEKRVLDRRLELLEAEGVVFRPGVHVGVDVTAADLGRDFDAVLLAGGASQARDLAVPGRDLDGVHFAMEYLSEQNRRCAGDDLGGAPITARDKHVVIIGGGDTGADCLGTALRQGARSVTQLELLPRPPADRAADNPWPLWPHVFRTSSAHEEGGERQYAVATTHFSGDPGGHVRRLHGHRVGLTTGSHGHPGLETVPESAFDLPADLVLLAMGFTGAGPSRLLADLGVTMTERGAVWRDHAWQTSVPGVFAAGDLQRGQSLIVWAIADGRQAAAAIDRYVTQG